MNINSYIEHTSLKPTLTDRDIDQLVEEAVNHSFHGICVPGFWVKKAHRELSGTSVKLVTIAGFPLGYSLTEVKLREMELAVENGADEIDMVLNLSAFKSGMNWPKIELAKCSAFCHQNERLLKVILETAYLSDQEIVEACKICEEAGVDYVKTSTGFAETGARVEHIELMRASVSPGVGIKAAGGIKKLEQLRAMVAAGADRIGTSSGVQIMKELEKEN